MLCLPGDSVPGVVKLDFLEQVLFGVLAAPTELGMLVEIKGVVGDFRQLSVSDDLSSQIFVQGTEQAFPVAGALELPPPVPNLSTGRWGRQSVVCSLHTWRSGWRVIDLKSHVEKSSCNQKIPEISNDPKTSSLFKPLSDIKQSTDMMPYRQMWSSHRTILSE
jgi:hypothetical protein